MRQSRSGTPGGGAWRKYRRGDHAPACRSGRQEPPQQVELFLAKPCNIHERFRSGQNRQQNQKQHFRQRIIDLANLAIVRQIVEVIKKALVSAIAAKAVPSSAIVMLHHENQWMMADSALLPFVTSFFIRLPWMMEGFAYPLCRSYCSLQFTELAV
jgi:hypothetical protein